MPTRGIAAWCLGLACAVIVVGCHSDLVLGGACEAGACDGGRDAADVASDVGTDAPAHDVGIDASCSDTTNDPNNCGVCGNVCGSGVCRRGSCCTASCDGLCVPSHYEVRTLEVGGEARWAFLEDYDRDGFGDVFVPCQYTEDTWFVRGNAAGTLAAETPIPTGRIGPGMDLGDLDGDGRTDVIGPIQASGPPSATELRIFHGLAAGAFDPTPTVLAQSGNPQWNAIVDANRDGRMDVAVRLPDSGCVGVRLQMADHSFAPASCVIGYSTVADEEILRASDADGDGFGELYEVRYMGGVAIWRDWLTATGTLDHSEMLGSPAGVVPNWIALTDVDRDGHDELFAFEGSGEATRVGLRTGRGTECLFEHIGVAPDALSAERLHASGDLDGDGVLDFIGVTTCGACTSNVYVHLGRP